MGYRFTLESANTVANLTFGKVLSCYRDICLSEQSYYGFMYFLDQFHKNIYSNQKEKYIQNLQHIRETLHMHKSCMRHPNEMLYDDTLLQFHRGALNALYELSKMLNRCTIKSLLLPSMSNRIGYERDAFMTSEETLRYLVNLHPGDSCLILQPQERPRTATIFDSFPNFEIALKQADQWPAVLFWDNSNNYVFVPVENEGELLCMYELIKYERKPIGELKRIAEGKKKQNHYLFQLSDLHFGSKNVGIAEQRLKSLIKSQLAKIDFDDTVNFVITGDAVDSPSSIAENNYRDFAEFLEERSGQKTIRILGNHDVNNHGLAFLNRRQTLAHIIGQYPKIEIIEESKLILLLFNSNTDGSLAKGKIGEAQMAEMGNLIDKIPHLEQYHLVAVLHHHLSPIPTPNCYDEAWYKKIIPHALLDEGVRLVDAGIFTEWLYKRNIKLVLHGHKHIPFLSFIKGICVLACGSSTGQITHKEKGKTYISYNIVKISKTAITCSQFAEELLGAGAKNIRTDIFSI